MNIGACKVKLRFPENQSLKGKRRVLSSIITRVRNNYHVSIAEVDDQDLWQLATLGIAYVSNSAKQVNEVLSRVIEFISQSKFDVEILEHQIEILPSLQDR